MPKVKIIVKVDPIRLRGVELTIAGNAIQMRNLEFDNAIFDDLTADGFVEVGPLEFNLYQAGII